MLSTKLVATLTSKSSVPLSTKFPVPQRADTRPDADLERGCRVDRGCPGVLVVPGKSLRAVVRDLQATATLDVPTEDSAAAGHRERECRRIRAIRPGQQFAAAIGSVVERVNPHIRSKTAERAAVIDDEISLVVAPIVRSVVVLQGSSLDVDRAALTQAPDCMT